MNVESTTTATITKTTDTASTAATTNSAAADGAKTFKDELQATAKTQEAETKEIQAETDSAAAKKVVETNAKNEADNQQEILNQQNSTLQKNAAQTLSAQVSKTPLVTEKDSKKTESTSDKTDISNPLIALKETISTLKGSTDFRVNSVVSKLSQKTDDKASSSINLKMNNEDVSFFLSLVQNDQMTVQTSQVTGAAANLDNNFTEIKSAATQQPIQVSAAMLEALNQSSLTGKSVRIDFDNNIAVIMKLDKNGVISANFIPGDAAVENYLRNNIATLQQNFDEQNLAYNELTYTKQQKQEQKEQKNNKEQKDE